MIRIVEILYWINIPMPKKGRILTSDYRVAICDKIGL